MVWVIERFEEVIMAAESLEELLKMFDDKPFAMGAHKAFLLARNMRHLRSVKLVSALDPATVRGGFMEPYNSLQEAVAAALAETSADSEVIINPLGSSILPLVNLE